MSNASIFLEFRNVSGVRCSTYYLLALTQRESEISVWFEFSERMINWLHDLDWSLAMNEIFSQYEVNTNNPMNLWHWTGQIKVHTGHLNSLCAINQYVESKSECVFCFWLFWYTHCATDYFMFKITTWNRKLFCSTLFSLVFVIVDFDKQNFWYLIDMLRSIFEENAIFWLKCPLEWNQWPNTKPSNKSHVQ